MQDRNGGGCFSRRVLQESESFRELCKELSIVRLCWACSESISRAPQGAAIPYCLFINVEEGVLQPNYFQALLGCRDSSLQEEDASITLEGEFIFCLQNHTKSGKEEVTALLPYATMAYLVAYLPTNLAKSLE